jgi:hypothetical protein
MEFLRKLATTATQQRACGVARVALPTRFASTGLRGEPVQEAGEDQARASHVPPSRDDATRVLSRLNSQTAIVDPLELQHSRRHAEFTPASRTSHGDSDESALPRATRPLAHFHGHSTAAEAPAGAQPPRVNHQPSEGDSIALTIERDALSGDSGLAADTVHFLNESSSAPLSDAALFARARRESERPAVVQVTIDRIDVRAPVQKTSPPSRAAGPTPPSTTLESFLRGTHSARDAS